MRARWSLLAATLVVAAGLAGCTEDAPAASGEPVRPGSSEPGELRTPPPPPRKTPSERWHFHDHWKGNPVLVLVDTNATLNATTGGDGLPALSALVELPTGTIVPPETGVVTVNVSWAGTSGLLNLTFRPADSNGFFGVADLPNGGSAEINVTESMADVPHRAQSLWAFNLTARPGGASPGLPDTTVHVVITAKIGRQLFIDPPHLDWWAGGDVAPLVLGAEGTIDTARTPVANVTLPGEPVGEVKPSSVTSSRRVPAEEGRIVPEGARSVVVLLNWSSDVPDARLTVRYREANLPSEGPMTLAIDGGTFRVFTLPVDPDQTDTTYSNRTTWEFEVLPDGGPAAAFHGGFTLYAWVARLSEDEAVEATVGTG